MVDTATAATAGIVISKVNTIETIAKTATMKRTEVSVTKVVLTSVVRATVAIARNMAAILNLITTIS